MSVSQTEVLEWPCPYCKEQEIELQDKVYQPHHVVCCQDDKCQQRAAWDLWITVRQKAVKA